MRLAAEDRTCLASEQKEVQRFPTARSEIECRVDTSCYAGRGDALVMRMYFWYWA
jgi:hypothetical protein